MTSLSELMASFENWERLGREEIRVKVGLYLEKLSSAGHRDVEELTYYGLAYLRILHEGPEPRYSGSEKSQERSGVTQRSSTHQENS